jgi:hypothetical protein
MRILVDDKGWKLVGDASDSTEKRASGVFPKLDPSTGASSLETASEPASQRTRSERDAELAQARTEPSPPSDAAVAHAGLRMPTAPRVPADFARDAGIAQDQTAFDAGFEAPDFESTDDSVASGEKTSSEDEARVA